MYIVDPRAQATVLAQIGKTSVKRFKVLSLGATLIHEFTILCLQIDGFYMFIIEIGIKIIKESILKLYYSCYSPKCPYFNAHRHTYTDADIHTYILDLATLSSGMPLFTF